MKQKILTKMNNTMLRGKIIILLIVCVVIPLITTNSYILWSVKNSINKEQKQELESIADRLEFELQNRLSKHISIADYLNRNEKLQQFLEKDYADATEYYEAYVQLLEDEVIQYYYTSQSVQNIAICTENDTITNGSYFIEQKTAADSSWYQKYIDSGKKLCLYAFFEDGQDSGGYIEKGRHVVIMQELYYCGKNSMIMIDMDYQDVVDTMQMLCGDAEGYICMEDKILFSTQETSHIKKDFTRADAYDKKEYFLKRDMEVFGETVTIYVTADRQVITSMLKDEVIPMFLLYVLNLVLPLGFVYILYKSLHDRIAVTRQYLEHMKEGVYEVLPIEEGRDEIGDMVHSYNLMVVQIKELIEVIFKNKEKEQSLEISKKQAELNALQSQLNPHFIFNALESIRMHSIIKQEKETAKILENFAALMRKNIQWNQDFITIEEECESVERYLEIQKYRFGDRLDYYLYVQEECKTCRIPKFIIITFVENACVHGIEKSVDGGSITVMVSEDETHLYFEIMDKGSGMKNEDLEQLRVLIEQADIAYIQHAKKSIGIINAVIRMKQYYGEGVKIDISSAEHEGTEISIQIPKEEGQE
ncbi:MAG: histidine kinase [Lachnospiraceae bacterium]|nr:histidine kinase [Lachnospiraceae bacterium]